MTKRLRLIDGGQHQQDLGCVPAEAGVDGETWDGWAEITLAQIIRRVLTLTPPPDDAQTAEDLRRWSENLLRDGQARLRAAGARQARAV
jgi:hypothetical protein